MNLNTKLKRVRRQAQSALASFTFLEKKLTKVNDKITKHVQEIESVEQGLAAAKQTLLAHHQQNTHVLGQVSKILRP